ncbi:MAG: fructose-1,6-bisphosphate aldolase, partial [Betaproteobacteria bacterium HGW-Betaproteobacteria-21]
NIDTDLRLAMSGAIRRLVDTDRKEFDPRKFFKAARDAAAGICRERFEAFGCAGQASRIKPLSLDAIARRYAPRKAA